MDLAPLHDRPAEHAESPFLDRLTLTRVDRDIFTGWCHAGAPLRAFGGQVAAQALVAAGSTVPDERRVHSLHAYFLRPGRTSDHIVYLVDRPRDGRSFSTRRVRAVQYGETIFTLSASFALDQVGPEHQSVAADTQGREQEWLEAVPSPTEIKTLDVLGAAREAAERSPRQAEDEVDDGLPGRRTIDLRFIPTDVARAATGGRSDQMVWVRTLEALPDDDLVQACAMTYFSDLTLVGTVLEHHGGRPAADGHDLASIDHGMWFHRPFRADRWLLFATDSPVATGGHAFARGQFFTEDGVLVASAAQEVLIRERSALQT